MLLFVSWQKVVDSWSAIAITMSRLIVLLILTFISFNSSGDFVYAGLEFIESEMQDTSKNDDLMLMGGLDITIDRSSSVAVEISINDSEYNNGAFIKTNLLYNHALMNLGTVKPYLSAGIFGVVYETEICPTGNNNFQTTQDCSSDFSNKMGFVFSLGSEIKLNNDRIFLLKLSTLKDYDNNRLISLTLAEEF